MKKFVYLCGMMLLCMNVMAQIDPYDRNWDTVVFDDFDEPNRQFDRTFQESEGKWISFSPSLWPSGITKWTVIDGRVLCDHQIYQWKNCVFDDGIFDGANGVLKLNSQFISSTPIQCNDPSIPYDIPPASPAYNNITYQCDTEHQWLYYFSGMIQSPLSEPETKSDNLPDPLFRYGYFEIRCKLPVHEGAFPAFWLWDSMRDQYYEENDIFEVSRYFTDSLYTPWTHNPNPLGLDDKNTFTTGIYYNDTGSSSVADETSQARKYPAVASNTDLTDWHTFACEWLPESVTWYCDGNIVNEYHNPDSIPHHHLSLITNYAIDRYAMQSHSALGSPEWQDNDIMIIDYIKVLQLQWDCDNDVNITCQSDLDGFVYNVKKSISIPASNEPVRVVDTNKVTFRATDSFEITGPFEVDSGGEMTVIMQSCPTPER